MARSSRSCVYIVADLVGARAVLLEAVEFAMSLPLTLDVNVATKYLSLRCKLKRRINALLSM